jgi:hypothetical protein
MSKDTMPDKLFLTSWPNGTLIPVKTLGKHPSIKDGIYIWYLGGSRSGSTDTTTDEFLFDLPDADTVPRDKVEALIDYTKLLLQDEDICFEHDITTEDIKKCIAALEAK